MANVGINCLLLAALAVVGPMARAGSTPEGMAQIIGGTFVMGDDDEWPEERPAHEVTVSPFWIDRHEVTNSEFARFVEATGYRTIGELGLDPAARPDLPPGLRLPGGMVFKEPPAAEARGDVLQWWSFVPGASWRHPEGPGSDIAGKGGHPVVQVALEDASAYARWDGRDLPTEAEWELAARGGLDRARYSWGDGYDPVEGWKANSWQGAFPISDDRGDGFHGTAPVGSFPANGYGLYDMTGNVWEYTRTWYLPGHVAAPAIDPPGPGLASAAEYGGTSGPRVVIKGGSWLCAPGFCLRYRPAARQPQELSLGSNHIGFRTVLRASPAADRLDRGP